MIIYYDHKERQCYIEDAPGNHSVKVELPVVIELWNSLKIDDSNLALTTLAAHDWDMDAVEQYYRDCANRR